MFGSGSTSGFGGFGSTPTATPFNSSAFSKPAGTAFGSTAFGAPAAGAAGSSVFGSTGTTFGAAAPAFGATATPTAGFGGFGTSTSAAPAVFGAPRTQAAPLFGAAGTGAFGAPVAQQPAKTGFSFGSGTSVFGQQQQAPTGTATLFSAGTAAQPAAFGATPTAFGTTGTGAMTGTTVKFNPLTGTDTMVKNNAQQHINTRFMCIVTMKEYESKSLEELRMEDYAANRKGPQAGSGFGQPAGGLFGAASSAGSGLFGATQSKPLFGAASTPASGGLFGAPQQQQTGTGLFGAKPAGFGAPATSTGFSGFGQPASSGTGLFGAAQPSKPLFGAPASSGGLFSGAATSQPTPAFGSTLTSQPSTGLFGAAPASTGGFSFSGGAQPAAGAPAAGGLFGSKPAFSGFGQTQPAAGSAFSFNTAAKPAGSAFNFSSTGSTFGPGTGSLFSNPAKPAAPTFGSGFGLGFTSQSTTLTGLGAPTQQMSLFAGQPAAAAQQPAAGAAAAQLQQQIMTLTANPFGDLPLFRNLAEASVTRQDVLKPTNPQAQKVITEAAPYKVSPRLVSKLTPKPITQTPGKLSLFDGLDEDGEDEAEILVPRRRVKKLDIKAATSGTPSRGPEWSAAAAAASPGERPAAEPTPLATPLPRATASKLHVTFSPEYGDSPEIIRGQLRTPHLAKEAASPGADDTISKLNPRKPAPAGRQSADAVGENKENVSESFILDDTVSEDGGDDAAAEPEPDAAPHPSGVTLRRPGYYTLPPLDELRPAADGSLTVDGLTIGRHGYGSVFFPGRTELAGLDLDRIVVFRRREVCIYPDDALKPPLGQGLNKPAQVTLERVWPTDKASREPITDPERLARMGWEQRLERACVKLGASFVEYRPETGSWVFKVDHFSKYGLNDSDEEEAGSPVLAACLRPRAGPAQLAAAPPGAPAGPPGPLLPPAATLVKEAAPVPPPPARLAHDGLQQLAPTASPAVQLARSMAIDSEKVQEMKVLFMEEDEGIEDDGGSQPEEETGAGPLPAFRLGLLSEPTVGPLAARRPPEGPSPPQSEPDAWDDQEAAFGARRVEVVPAEPPLDRSLMESCRLLESETHQELPPIVPRYVNTLAPLARSTRASAGLQLADLGSMMGCRWRLGWGPGWRLSAAAGAGAPLPFAVVGGRVSASARPDDLKAEYADLLAVQLRFSSCELSPGGVWPLFTTCADLALPEALAETDHQWADVWRLVVALWGRLDFRLPAADERECREYAERQGRRETLSRWLESTCRPVVAREVEEHTDDQYLETVFALLTVRQVWEAAKVAQRHGDACLSLLLTQVTGSHEARQLVRSQLENWRQVGADRHISRPRLRLYMLVAGLAVWQTSGRAVVNVCDGLDWRRALAVHLWYLSPATSSVSEVLAQYDEACRASDDCAPLAPPPLPAYLPDHGDSGADWPRDVCHHLLRLYAGGGGRLERLLAPATHTAEPLDHKLSWLLMECLDSLGYKHVPEHCAELLHVNLAAQLEGVGLWHLAAFVLLHIADLDRRRAACSDLLLRHVTLDLADDVRELLVDKFGIPVPVLSYAQAVRARALGRRREEARLLLLAERWQEGHDLLVEHIAPECIINEEYAALGELLSRLSPPDVSARVCGWSAAGQVYVDYIAVSEAVRAVLAGRADAEKLQRLRPQLATVSQRIADFRCPTATHRLAQAEMAKKAATLLRALLDAGGSTGVGAALLEHLARLPLPEDFALDELQHVLRSYLLELNV